MLIKPEHRRKVIIVGGGSSGWMTAAYLSRAFGREIQIEVLESSNIATIGVGEATFSDIHLFFNFLGLKEEHWMRECNASYKVAIRFVDWNADRRSFYHPFQQLESIEGRSIADWWLKLRSHQPFDYACFTAPVICDAKRAPRYIDGSVYEAPSQGHWVYANASDALQFLDHPHAQYSYAYHFDAGLFANVMARYACERGVSRVLDDVINVEIAENGFIRALQTREHGNVEGDLFIDCTGFKGVLINQALKEPFISFLDSLPCDSAVAMQVPRARHLGGCNPYTTATALNAGWVWDIPLMERTGTGYVYSSAYLSCDQAEADLRAHLGGQAEGYSALHIKMRVGRCRKSWVNNCVAIGLSSGFVEPLESTGLFFVQHSLEHLVSHFQTERFEEEIIESYNRVIAECMDGVREFLTMHYVASTREDSTFWRMTKNDLHVPDGLAERLRGWKKRLPTRNNIYSRYHGFGAHNYCAMLLGLGEKPSKYPETLRYMSDGAALSRFKEIEEKAHYLREALPSLDEYLAEKYGRGPSIAREKSVTGIVV